MIYAVGFYIWASIEYNRQLSNQWLSTRLQYLQCVNNGDIAVLHLIFEMVSQVVFSNLYIFDEFGVTSSVCFDTWGLISYKYAIWSVKEFPL